eukprot:630271-Pleurochrysis_carterae.AAC.1
MGALRHRCLWVRLCVGKQETWCINGDSKNGRDNESKASRKTITHANGCCERLRAEDCQTLTEEIRLSVCACARIAHISTYVLVIVLGKEKQDDS